jgi:hypothetical protein
MNGSIIPPEGRSPEDERLDELFRAYRVACEPREVSANFMPELWQRIERAQSATFSFRRIAKGFVTAAAALSLVLFSIGLIPSQQVSPVYNATYLETLDAHDTTAADSVDASAPDSLEDTEEI